MPPQLIFNFNFYVFIQKYTVISFEWCPPYIIFYCTYGLLSLLHCECTCVSSVVQGPAKAKQRPHVLSNSCLSFFLFPELDVLQTEVTSRGLIVAKPLPPPPPPSTLYQGMLCPTLSTLSQGLSITV